jgi:hypothetical protein
MKAILPQELHKPNRDQFTTGIKKGAKLESRIILSGTLSAHMSV